MKELQPLQITAIVLAGGKGRRLEGSDKGLVTFKQRPLIEHVLEAIAPQVSHIIINANRNTQIYEGYDYPVISDALSDFQGPLAGFATAMSQATTSHILTLPCDGPFISADYASRMSAALAENQAEIAVAHDGKRLQPVHALIPVNLLNSLTIFLASGERKIDFWYAQHTIALVDFSDKPSAFRNINTAEQLKTLEKTAND